MNIKYKKHVVVVFWAFVLSFPAVSIYAQEKAQEKPQEKLTNQACLDCHADNDPVIDQKIFNESVHNKLACVDCHSDVKDTSHAEKLAKVDCSSCHKDVGKKFALSIHSKLAKQGKPNLPGCPDCHGKHDIFSIKDPRSLANHLRSDGGCLKCHTNKEILKQYPDLPKADFVRKYLTSVHGRGVHFKGLNVSATCADCHGAHEIQPASDPDSEVSKKNVPKTCAKCHEGIYKQYITSIHGKLWLAGRPDAPVCTSCHSEHGVDETQTKQSRMAIAGECGHCHHGKVATYSDTFHGQSTSLGFMRSAKCVDCHSTHEILPAKDPRSSVNKANLRATCAKCHNNINNRFIGYDPHANPQDKDSSPLIYYTFQFMKWLMICVFGFWGVHTLLWFQRSVVAIIRREFVVDRDSQQYVRRFSDLQRRLHGVVVTSFLGLVMTGLPLKYYYAPWAKALASFLGGMEVTRYFHRVCGLITIGYFLFHLIQMSYKLIVQKDKGLLYGPNSLVPRGKDWKDFVDNIKWFFYKGNRPRYDRWTYFEKFDYMAVFWGVCVIGLSGLVLWFPSFFTKFLPGEALNVAAIVHSDEALLALAFIFIVHFFHNHLRVENFPIDLSVFSGVIPLERFMKERPEEYERLVREGNLQKILVPRPTTKTFIKCMVFGLSTLALGLAMIIAIFATFLMMPK